MTRAREVALGVLHGFAARLDLELFKATSVDGSPASASWNVLP